jgi:hypothetical protein
MDIEYLSQGHSIMAIVDNHFKFELSTRDNLRMNTQSNTEQNLC